MTVNDATSVMSTTDVVADEAEATVDAAADPCVSLDYPDYTLY